MTAVPSSMRIAIITDLDHDSRVGGAEKPTWKSIYKRGNLSYDRETNKYSVEWEDDVVLTSHVREPDGRLLFLFPDCAVCCNPTAKFGLFRPGSTRRLVAGWS